MFLRARRRVDVPVAFPGCISKLRCLAHR